ncbi:hypothetical protein FEM48_ZijujUnG0028600 [Ziziphus jujuba var. spinosa]|uniref:Uncharacterized protein n=1 Tax=Ziziphus jujuba var. spinosa TaxID=714518 RepID=A0A978U9K9_ZIZJJ|nr:hypothetical protein FEM48_ZijujUnG0028600 [Ziziphus jujuba var. spinosa]
MFSTNYLVKYKGIRTRSSKNKRAGITNPVSENKQEEITTRCPENKQLMIRSPQHASPITFAGMDYDNIKCKTCNALPSVPRTAPIHGCSKCNTFDYLTPKIQQPSANRSNKHALHCGVTYNGTKKYKLKGTVNDVINMQDLLIDHFGYPPYSI